MNPNPTHLRYPPRPRGPHHQGRFVTILLVIACALHLSLTARAAITGTWNLRGYEFEAGAENSEARSYLNTYLRTGTLTLTAQGGSSYRASWQIGSDSGTETFTPSVEGNRFTWTTSETESDGKSLERKVIVEVDASTLTLNVFGRWGAVNEDKSSLRDVWASTFVLTKTVLPAPNANAWAGVFDLPSNRFSTYSGLNGIDPDFGSAVKLAVADRGTTVVGFDHDLERFTLQKTSAGLSASLQNASPGVLTETGGEIIERVRSYDETHVLQLGDGRLFVAGLIADVGHVQYSGHDHLQYAESYAEIATPAQPTSALDFYGDTSFGGVAVGASTKQTVTLQNIGSAACTVSNLSYPAGFSGNWNGGTIAAGSSQNVTVTFAPTAATNQGGNITITTDADFGFTTLAVSGVGLPGGGGGDGITWVAQPAYGYEDVIWTGSQFLAVGWGRTTTSPDGTIWTDSVISDSNAPSVVWTGSQFITADNSGFETSTDGLAWSAPNSSAFSNVNFRDFVWNGQAIVAVSWDQIHVTTDLLTATTSDLRQSIAQDFRAITWTGTQYVVVGEHGTLLTSPNASTWTSRTSGTIQQLRNVLWTGNLLVAVGEGGTILTSPDGVAWTARASGTTQDLYGLTYSGSLFVAVGNAGTILTSPDATTWTSRTSGTTSNLKNITWNATRFVAVGDSVILTNDGAFTSGPNAPEITQQPSDVAVLVGRTGFLQRGRHGHHHAHLRLATLDRRRRDVDDPRRYQRF